MVKKPQGSGQAGMHKRRPTHLCRSWLFLNGAEAQTLKGAVESGSDVLIQEFEDFTPPALRPDARGLATEIYAEWRTSNVVVAARINPLESDDGMADLTSIMAGDPDIVALPKVEDPAQVVTLARELDRLERELGRVAQSTEILPNIELARGVMQTFAIARASPRVRACLLASEDLAADLGAERGRDGIELAYCRQRFLMECVAARVMAVDYPYTWRDNEGVEAETRMARRLGFKAKSAVVTEHAAIINSTLTPTQDEVDNARRIVTTFEAAQAGGDARVDLDGSMIEVPIYTNAKRLLQRAKDLAER
ncbi:MAG: HpcH/HpaI aldolase/citrate lyase family protein [Hyphomicrobiaceae bacterium]